MADWVLEIYAPTEVAAGAAFEVEGRITDVETGLDPSGRYIGLTSDPYVNLGADTTSGAMGYWSTMCTLPSVGEYRLQASYRGLWFSPQVPVLVTGTGPEEPEETPLRLRVKAELWSADMMSITPIAELSFRLQAGGVWYDRSLPYDKPDVAAGSYIIEAPAVYGSAGFSGFRDSGNVVHGGNPWLFTHPMTSTGSLVTIVYQEEYEEPGDIFIETYRGVDIWLRPATDGSGAVYYWDLLGVHYEHPGDDLIGVHQIIDGVLDQDDDDNGDNGNGGNGNGGLDPYPSDGTLLEKVNWVFAVTGGALGLGAALLLAGVALEAAGVSEADVRRAKDPVK